jgi:HAD superfamily hydrolase (TIGR01509 family)
VIKAVIFDLDGTLVPFTLDVKACRTKVIQYLTEQGFASSFFSMKETAFDMLVKVQKHITTRSDKQNFAEIKKMVHSIVESFELDAARSTKMFPGVPETLKTLKDLNLKIALCTISGEKAAEHIIDRFGLEAFFDVRVMREYVPAVKPNPIHLEVVLEALKVEAQEAVLVGDSVKDILCANRLNVLAVGVTTGLSSMDALVHAGANYIVSSTNEIPSLVIHLNKQLTEGSNLP